jgi:hypothetical protein
MNCKTVLLATLFFGCGCENFRFLATEAQKQNAWLHLRTTQLTAEQAADETASQTLQDLAAMSAQQSQAFVADCGLPSQVPAAASADQILASAGAVAQQAQADGARRIDPWSAADGLFELGIGLAGLIGGAYGLKAAAFFRQAREKAQALQEIIHGNELFKQVHTESAEAFKEAQENQSPATRRLVTELKTAG